MHRPNDATIGHQQPLDRGGDWGSSAAQDAWKPENFIRGGYRQASRDNNDMENELNDGLNFNIFDHNDHGHPNKAVSELHSGENNLDSASLELRRSMHALHNGDSERAMGYLRDSLHDIKEGVGDLKDGMRHNPDDSRKDVRGERRVHEGIDEISDSQNNLKQAMQLLKEGDEEGAMKLLRRVNTSAWRM